MVTEETDEATSVRPKDPRTPYSVPSYVSKVLPSVIEVGYRTEGLGVPLSESPGMCARSQ